MYRYVIAKLANGREVYINFIGSSAGHYLNRQPYVINLVKEVLADAKFTAVQVSIEQDMGRVIGKTDIVETSDKDIIYYAVPFKKTFYGRYAKSRYPMPSRQLSIQLQKDEAGHYEISDTWIGPSRPPFPGDENETPESRKFWQTHALVQDAQLIQAKTITRVCPY